MVHALLLRGGRAHSQIMGGGPVKCRLPHRTTREKLEGQGERGPVWPPSLGQGRHAATDQRPPWRECSRGEGDRPVGPRAGGGVLRGRGYGVACRRYPGWQTSDRAVMRRPRPSIHLNHYTVCLPGCAAGNRKKRGGGRDRDLGRARRVPSGGPQPDGALKGSPAGGRHLEVGFGCSPSTTGTKVKRVWPRDFPVHSEVCLSRPACVPGGGVAFGYVTALRWLNSPGYTTPPGRRGSTQAGPRVGEAGPHRGQKGWSLCRTGPLAPKRGGCVARPCKRGPP